jgi:branched-subunit amino acid aminotransferase/4-amino-4-deoxychorismate lyase
MTDRPEAFDLLETLRWTPVEGFFILERHLDRLRASAEYFGFPCSDDRVREALHEAVRSSDRAQRVRLLLAEDGTLRTESSILDPLSGPLRVGLAATPIDPLDVFLFHKTTNRAVYERARSTRADDVVLWNPKGEITESTIANMVVEVDGRRVTPPVECGLLAGTYRAELLATGEIIVATITVDQLIAARKFWLINSVRGWCPAVLVIG